MMKARGSSHLVRHLLDLRLQIVCRLRRASRRKVVFNFLDLLLEALNVFLKTSDVRSLELQRLHLIRLLAQEVNLVGDLHARSVP